MSAPPRERPAGTGAAYTAAAREQQAPRLPGAPPRLAPALAFLQRTRDALEQGSNPAAALAGAAGSLPSDVQGSIAAMARRLRGDYTEDEWGLDEEFAEAAYPFLEFMYERWWRVETTGAKNVPSHGRTLLVANHAGILPWDGTMMGVGLLKEHPIPRYPRFLVLNWAFELPWVPVALRKLGAVPASPYNAIRLLEQDELVAVFPEGVKGAGKDFKDRYRLQRFGRGGFVDIALRTGSPIVPVAVVGSEEIYPKIGESRALARLIGAPYFPITPTFPLLGPLGVVPLPSKWRIEFGEPIDLSGYGPDAADSRPLVFELSERVRDAIQEMLYGNLVKRGSAFV